jgi:hypothetical protein
LGLSGTVPGGRGQQKSTLGDRIVVTREKFETEILPQWVSEQLAAITMRRDLLKGS